MQICFHRKILMLEIVQSGDLLILLFSIAPLVHLVG
jgi:hypothetical protein